MRYCSVYNFHLLKISVLWDIVDSFDVMEKTKCVQVNAELPYLSFIFCCLELHPHDFQSLLLFVP